MANPESFQSYLSAVQTRIQAYLDDFLSRQSDLASPLKAAMRYSVLNGGKRIRPALAYAACEACGGTAELADAVAGAVELIHCYSLVHDDLPCMDDDDLRRGQPTCHRQFGEDIALLAGDSLQTLAFRLLLQSSVNAGVQVEMVRILAESSFGMAIGQALDLAAEGKITELNELENIHEHKTGALIRASLRLGALAAGQAREAQLQALDEFGEALGLAFQVQDDVLDVIGDTAVMGKQAGSDARLMKATYPSLLGLDAAQQLARVLHDEAIDCLAPLGSAAERLREITDYLVSRSH